MLYFSCRRISNWSLSVIMATCLVVGCRERAMVVKTADSENIVSAIDAEVPEHGFLGLTFESVESTPLVIKEPVPGSPAAELQIQEGDQLAGVGNRHNPTLEDIYAVLVETTPGQKLPVTIVRGIVILELELVLLSFNEVQSAMEAAHAESAKSK